MLIGEYLVEHEVITKEQIDKALEIQKNAPEKKVGEILIEMKVITYDTLIEYLDIQLHEKFDHTK